MFGKSGAAGWATGYTILAVAAAPRNTVRVRLPRQVSLPQALLGLSAPLHEEKNPSHVHAATSRTSMSSMGARTIFSP